MLPWLLGLVGFGLYFLYDVNSFTADRRLLRPAFALGSALIALATVQQLLAAAGQNAFSQPGDPLLLGLGLLAFLALLYCLFFALPFDSTYVTARQGRRVCTGGAYALCRHPGILCFFAAYLFWGLAARPFPFLGWGLSLSALNLLYAWFQDRVTFPRTFCDYAAYRETTPFLFPTRSSLRRAVKTWGKPYEKEEKP